MPGSGDFGVANRHIAERHDDKTFDGNRNTAGVVTDNVTVKRDGIPADRIGRHRTPGKEKPLISQGFRDFFWFCADGFLVAMGGLEPPSPAL